MATNSHAPACHALEYKTACFTVPSRYQFNEIQLNPEPWSLQLGAGSIKSNAIPREPLVQLVQFSKHTLRFLGVHVSKWRLIQQKNEVLKDPIWHIGAKFMNSNEISRGNLCKNDTNCKESNEIRRGPPSKTDANSTKSNEFLRRPRCRICRHDLRNTHNGHKCSLEDASPKQWKMQYRRALNPIVLSFCGFRRLPSHQRPVKYSEISIFRRIPSTPV